MRDTTNYTTTKETSKVFKRLGQLVGIKATRRTQRGIIARKALRILEDYELEEFSKSMPKFNLENKSIKVNGGGKTWYI